MSETATEKFARLLDELIEKQAPPNLRELWFNRDRPAS